MKRLILICTLILIATTGFAAKKEKTLICHVRYEMGPNGEVYDPACEPGEDNDYFCANAGKIDLIVTSKPAKHLDNPSHEWDGISDYEPSEVGASGNGTEDSDGNGVDDGCEPPVECPCWAEAELQAVTKDNFIHWFEMSCSLSDEPNTWALIAAAPGSEWGHNFGFDVYSNPNHPSGPIQFCQVFDYPDHAETDVTPAEADICISQVVKRCADIGHPYPSE
jgi:hypothetical protein